MIAAIAKGKSICGFADGKAEAKNVKPYSIVGIGYPVKNVVLEDVDRFDAGRIQ